MVVQQLYTKCLAQGAYYIESNGEAIIIDPLRETQPYLDLLEQNQTKLVYILETHFHADFVSGHIDLAHKTGARIVYGPNANCKFDHLSAMDGDQLQIGDLMIQVLHTPGHTLESCCFLLHDKDGDPTALFTGDTLFIGDVGRPDLAIKSDLSKRDLASMMFDSLRNKIIPLPDHITVYPAHGAGSACGKNMSKETFDSLGNQKVSNYALDPKLEREQFIDLVLDGLQEAPSYFSFNAQMNKNGYNRFDDVIEKGSKALSKNEYKRYLQQYPNLITLDTRDPQVFKNGYVKGSLSIGINGGFAPWVGAILGDVSLPIVFIAPKGREKEVSMRLARVGFDHQLGYLPLEIYKADTALDQVESQAASILVDKQYNDSYQIIDIRKPAEYHRQHLTGAINIPLSQLQDRMSEIDTTKTSIIHCQGGYRSMIAASLLKKSNIDMFIEIKGGFNDISSVPGLDFTQKECSSGK